MVNGYDVSFMFGDNVLVANYTVMPDGKLQRQSHILNYHHTWEARDKGMIKFVHIKSNNNPANIVTNGHASNTWLTLIKPLLFWHDMDFFKERFFPRGVKTGHQNRLSTNIRAFLVLL